MKRTILSVAGLLFLSATMSSLAQEPQAVPATAVPAATVAEIECSGFIPASALPEDFYIFDAADNDFHHPNHQFASGDYVYLRSRIGTMAGVGAEYRVVRPAKELMMRTSWYPGQTWSLRALGKVYEDVGRVRVVSVTPQAAVAQVAFACGPIRLGDLALPHQARAIPEYTPSAGLDRFALPNGKTVGTITAAASNGGFLGVGSIAYVDIGEGNGARPGQRYRIFHMRRLFPAGGLLSAWQTPRETIGELVILSTQERSSVAIVVASVREIAAGDGIGLE